jgi:hypothetical protein
LCPHRRHRLRHSTSCYFPYWFANEFFCFVFLKWEIHDSFRFLLWWKYREEWDSDRRWGLLDKFRSDRNGGWCGSSPPAEQQRRGWKRKEIFVFF